MGLDERIQKEMYVDTESLLEDEFDRTKELYDIYEDNTVVITDQYLNVGNKERFSLTSSRGNTSPKQSRCNARTPSRLLLRAS